MSSDLLNEIAMQTPPDIVVQYHWNGEPLLYPYLSEAFSLFHNNIRCLDTNAILLNERANDIIGNLETITISVIEKDPEAESQWCIDSLGKLRTRNGGRHCRESWLDESYIRQREASIMKKRLLYQKLASVSICSPIWRLTVKEISPHASGSTPTDTEGLEVSTRTVWRRFGTGESASTG
jgi:hypothetical protein